MKAPDQIVECWHDNGRNAAEVGRMLGLPRETVRRHLIEAGAVKRNTSRVSPSDKQITTGDCEDPLIEALKREEDAGRLRRPGKQARDRNNGH